jgi:hypothetical protein
MRKTVAASTTALLVAALAACGGPESGVPTQSAGTADSTAEVAAQTREAALGVEAPENAQEASATGPQPKPGGGFIAEESGVKGHLAIKIRWTAEIIKGIPDEGMTTTVYNHFTTLDCPITSGDESNYSYFAMIDNPAGDPMAATGSYQTWWNEDCTGTLKVDDTYHADDPTLAGPEPIVHTTGVRPLSTADAPLTVETDLNRSRTRYMFITPSTDGFEQLAVKGYQEGKLVAAAAAPMATMDITKKGPIGSGLHAFDVEGGVLQVDWSFKREGTTP